jgi:hypothetical protein
VLSLVLVQVAAAQASPAACDSACRDTTVLRGNPDNYGLLVLAGLLGVAPASPLLINSIRTQQRADTGSDVPDHYVIAYAAAGYVGHWKSDGWGLSQDVQAFSHHAYGEVRVQDLYAPAFVQVRTLTVGYLVHPVPQDLGGVTVGYRHANRPGAADALEIGLPLIAGGKSGIGRMRLEPIYAISAHGVSWDYRWESVFFPGRSAFVVSVDVEFKPLRQGAPYYGTLLLGFGLRR